MNTVRSAVFYSSINKYIVKIIALISTIVTARLLSPSEIGVFAIGSAIVMMISQLQIIGGSAYLVRESELTVSKIRSTLGASIIVYWSIGLFVIISALFIDKVYEVNGLEEVFIILGISFFFMPYVSVIIALYTRDYNYKIIMLVQVSGSLISLISVIILIELGFSFYSLAMAQVIGVATQVLLLFFLPHKKMKFMPSIRYISPVMKFGGINSVALIFISAQSSMADVVLGKVGTLSDVGLFSRGYGFMAFLSGSVTEGLMPVALAFFSKLKKDSFVYTLAYSKATSLLGGFLWPVLLVASVMSEPIILTLFGHMWIDAAPIASIIAFWFFIKSINVFYGSLMNSTGNEIYILVREFFVLLVLLVGVVPAFYYGKVGVAYLFIIAGLTHLFISSLVLVKVLGVDLVQFIRSNFKSFSVAILCYLFAQLIMYFSGVLALRSFEILILASLILPVIWISLIRIFRHDIWFELVHIYNSRFKSV